jgi:hypothetical protein
MCYQSPLGAAGAIGRVIILPARGSTRERGGFAAVLPNGLEGWVGWTEAWAIAPTMVTAKELTRLLAMQIVRDDLFDVEELRWDEIVKDIQLAVLAWNARVGRYRVVIARRLIPGNHALNYDIDVVVCLRKDM